MMHAHDVAAIRSAERELMAAVAPGTLMRRAAAGLAAVCSGLVGRVYGIRVVVLVGTGDNGGDALYAGARLARRGAAVTAVAAGPRFHAAGAAALRAAGGRVTGHDDPAVAALVGAADLIVDGLLGIGGRGGLREPYAGLAALAGRAGRERSGGTGRGGGALVVAVDLPSGIDADTGAVAGPAVRADVTVTFGTYKPGLLIDPGAGHAGAVRLIDIGLGPYLPAPAVAAPEAADVAALLPPPPADSDKYRRGVVGIVAGSSRFTGAAALAVGGAVRGGAGMVRLVSAPEAVAVVRQQWPEAVITVTRPDGAAGDGAAGDSAAGDGAAGDGAAGDGAAGDGAAGDGAGPGITPGDEIAAAGRVQAWVAGPGMGTGEAAHRRLAAVLATGLPVLVDADGLTLAAREPGLLARAAPTLLTPHAGELARLLGAGPEDVTARRLEHARRAADRFGVTVLLKGSTTVVARPGGAGSGEAAAPGAPAVGGEADGGGDADRDAERSGWDVPGLANPTGTSWLATAGTGDVLSGLAGALLAQGLAAPQAAAVAAFLHGLAARWSVTAGSGPAGPDRPGADRADSGRGLAWPALARRPHPGGGAPIGAGDVVAGLPAAFRAVRGAAAR